MLFMMFFLGIITILAGILPFLGSLSFIPASLVSGSLYYAIIIVIGIIGVLYGFLNYNLLGMSRFIAVFLGALTLLGGVIPLINQFLPFVPAQFITGWIYSLIIIGLGVTGLIFGSTHMV